jgi:hypothetical protein
VWPHLPALFYVWEACTTSHSMVYIHVHI